MKIDKIKENFDSVKWEKGRVYAKHGQVKILEIESGYLRNGLQDLPVLHVQAIVTGSNSHRNYSVEVLFSEERIEQATCNCPDCSNGYYKWMSRYCKHIAAVIMAATESEKMKAYDLYTGRSARQLMELFTQEAVTQTVNKNAKEAVFIEPCLMVKGTVDYFERKRYEWSVSFKIGNKKKYVIKNLTTFRNMIKNNEVFSYGKDFEFLHNESIFHEDSKKLLNFILSRVEETEALSDRMRNEVVEIKREIPFTPHNIDDFMSGMIGESISYILDDFGYKTKGTVVVVEENPEIHLDILPSYNGNQQLEGVSLTMKDVKIFQGNQASYQLTESKIMRSSKEFVETIKPFMEVMGRDQDKEIRIGNSLMASFYGEVLPQLSPYINIHEKDAEKIREILPEKAEIFFYFDMDEMNCIFCQVKVKCGDQELAFWDNGDAIKYAYYVDRAKALAILDKYVIETEEEQAILRFTDEDERIFEFFYEGIEALAEIGEVHGTDQFKNVNITRKPKVDVKVQLKSNLLDLEINTQDFELNELKDILNSYHRKKKFHRLRNGSFMNIDNETISGLSDLVEGLHLKDKDYIKGKLHISAYRALYVDRILQENEELEYERNNKFKKLVRDFKSIEDSDYEVPDQLKNILRNYQKVGYRWLCMLQEYHLGGILADDMGLGKTLQVITLLLAKQGQGTTLVITPASLVYNWESEFQRFAPTLKIGVVSGNPAERKEVIDDYSAYDVLISSYDLVKRDISCYEGKQFYYEIIDEAQYIKNQSTLVAKSVKAIQGTYKLALTGTPIENRLSELWSIFDYLMPGFLYGYEQFRKEMEVPIVKDGDPQLTARLKKLVAPFILRRLKRDVLKELPEKIEKVTFAKMDMEQEKLYTAYVSKVKEEMETQPEGEFAKNKLKILAELTRLRQICCDPSLVYENYKGGSAKLETCMELVGNARDGDHKVLLFSQFTSVLSIISNRLKEEGISYYEITGATPKMKRLQLVEAFNEDDTSVFLISLKAGGTGLNLTSADVVIHYDPWWNIAAQNQATDRAHRIGQANVVTVFQLIAKGTIEEKIIKMQEAKKKLADQIISGEENQLSSMTKEDFLQLFRDEE